MVSLHYCSPSNSPDGAFDITVVNFLPESKFKKIVNSVVAGTLIKEAFKRTLGKLLAGAMQGLKGSKSESSTAKRPKTFSETLQANGAPEQLDEDPTSKQGEGKFKNASLDVFNLIETNPFVLLTRLMIDSNDPFEALDNLMNIAVGGCTDKDGKKYSASECMVKNKEEMAKFQTNLANCRRGKSTKECGKGAVASLTPVTPPTCEKGKTSTKKDPCTLEVCEEGKKSTKEAPCTRVVGKFEKAKNAVKLVGAAFLNALPMILYNNAEAIGETAMDIEAVSKLVSAGGIAAKPLGAWAGQFAPRAATDVVLRVDFRIKSSQVHDAPKDGEEPKGDWPAQNEATSEVLTKSANIGMEMWNQIGATIPTGVVTVKPTFAANMLWDFTPWLDAMVNWDRQGTLEERQEHCRKCVLSDTTSGYCNRDPLRVGSKFSDMLEKAKKKAGISWTSTARTRSIDSAKALKKLTKDVRERMKGTCVTGTPATAAEQCERTYAVDAADTLVRAAYIESEAGCNEMTYKKANTETIAQDRAQQDRYS